MSKPLHTILILGSGHLAYRVEKLAIARGFTTIHIQNDKFHFADTSGSALDKITNKLSDVDFSTIAMGYIIDDRDDYNLQLLIALMSMNDQLAITVSLFNENVAPHLRAAHPNLHILNPAKIAAPFFVEALDKPVDRILRYSPSKPPVELRPPKDSFIKLLISSFVLLVLATTMYFHFFEKIPWLDSFYFVVVTITTVGYGDISLANASALSKVIGIMLILSSTFFIWMIFSLTIDRVIKKRIQLSLGIKKYLYKDHIVLCGLGKLGYFIAEELLKRSEKIVIVESNENSPNIHYFRKLGADVYIGNARLPRVLQDVSVAKAKAVISVVDDDYLNLEIGLNARSLQPGLKLILRFFDDSMAQKIKEKLDIHFTLSMSAIADERFLETIPEI